MPCKRCSIPSEGGLTLPPLTSGLGVSLPTFTPEPRLSQQTGPVRFPFSTRRSILGENDSERPAPLTPCQARRNACGAQRVKTDRGPRLTTCTSVCPPIHFHQPVGTLCIWFPARGFPDTGKEPPYRCKRHKRHGFDPWVGKIPPGGGNGSPLQYSCWEMPWTEEPGGLPSVGPGRVGHGWGFTPPSGIITPGPPAVGA